MTQPAPLMAAREPGKTRPALADWVQRGAVLGLQGGTDKVRRIVGARCRRPAPRSPAVWLQDWTGKRTTSFGDRLWWTWQLDRPRYPGWNDGRATSKQGIQVLTYINPWLVDPTPKR